MQAPSRTAKNEEWRQRAFEIATEERAEAERRAEAAEAERKAAHDEEMKPLFAKLRAERDAKEAKAAQAEGAKKAAVAKEKSARDQAIKTKRGTSRSRAQ